MLMISIFKALDYSYHKLKKKGNLLNELDFVLSLDYDNEIFTTIL